jgi:hypothetical protein
VSRFPDRIPRSGQFPGIRDMEDVQGTKDMKKSKKL